MEQSRGLLSRYGQLEFQQSREWSGSPGGRGYRGPSAGAGGAEGAAVRLLELSFCNVVEKGWMETCPRSLERSLMMLWLASIHRRQ